MRWGKASGKVLGASGEGGWRGGGSSHSQGVVECSLVILKENNIPTNCSVLTALRFAPVLGLGSGSHRHRGGFSTAPGIQPQSLGKGLD